MLKKCALAVCLILAAATGVLAQTVPTQVAFGIYRDVNPNEVCVYDNNRVCRVFIAVPPSGPLQIQTLSFAPSELYASLSATTSSSRVVLPAGETVVVYNTGSVPAYVAFGNSSIVATTGKNVIQPQSWIEFDVGLNSYTNIAAITASGTATLNISGGTGLMTGSGGGGSSGGTSNVAITSPLSQDTAPSASVSIVPTAGFRPSASGARMTPLTVTTSDSSVALPTGVVVVVTNAGTTNPMYCNVNGVAATVADQLIVANGGQFPFTIPTGQTTLHCIATGGSTTANGLGGTGIPTPTGGGSASGTTGNVNVTQWNSVAVGSPATYGTAPTGNAPGVNAAAQGAVTTSAPTYTNGTQANLSLDTSGNLRATDSSVVTAIGANAVPVPLPVIQGNGDPCSSQAHIYAPISITSNTTTQITLLNGVASEKTYICHIHLFTGSINNVALVEGSGSTCGTGTAGLIGGTTAANGWNFVANQGLVDGTGTNAIAATATAANNVCIITSSSGPLTGEIVAAQQ